jgi:hypothetical protein
VLWKYECGLRLGNSSVIDVLRQAGVNAGHLRMEFAGLLYLSRPMTVSVLHRGGTPTGELALAVDGETLGEVGGERATSDVYKVELHAGEHAIRWVLAGGDLGVGALQFTDAETGKPLPVYHTQALLAAARETPFRARINVNMLNN